MKRARFTEEQIIGVLKEAGSGAKTGDLARRHGISEATIYNWKAKYGGLEVGRCDPAFLSVFTDGYLLAKHGFVTQGNMPVAWSSLRIAALSGAVPRRYRRCGVADLIDAGGNRVSIKPAAAHTSLRMGLKTIANMNNYSWVIPILTAKISATNARREPTQGPISAFAQPSHFCRGGSGKSTSAGPMKPWNSTQQGHPTWSSLPGYSGYSPRQPLLRPAAPVECCFMGRRNWGTSSVMQFDRPECCLLRSIASVV